MVQIVAGFMVLAVGLVIGIMAAIAGLFYDVEDGAVLSGFFACLAVIAGAGMLGLLK